MTLPPYPIPFGAVSQISDAILGTARAGTVCRLSRRATLSTMRYITPSARDAVNPNTTQPAAKTPMALRSCRGTRR